MSAAPAPAPPAYLDYRWQLVIADLGALSLLLGAFAGPSEPEEALVSAAIGVYALGAPAIHLGHGQPKRALASVGMRIGFPVLGGLPGYALLSSCDTTDDEYSDPDIACLVVGGLLTVVGAGGGLLTAVIIDDAVLGKVRRPELTTQTRVGTARVRLGAAPLVDPVRKTYGLSLSGSF